MKTKTVTVSLTALAALAMGFGAYFTMPDGPALNKQEKMLTGRALSFTDPCKVCTPEKGGINCTYNKAIANQPCALLGDNRLYCTGTKGDGRKCSKTRDVYTWHNPAGTTPCLGLLYECVQIGSNSNDMVWQRSAGYTLGDCGTYTDCNDEATSSPTRCEKECGEPGNE